MPPLNGRFERAEHRLNLGGPGLLGLGDGLLRGHLTVPEGIGLVGVRAQVDVGDANRIVDRQVQDGPAPCGLGDGVPTQ